MTLFDEILAGLRDARLIASPYAKAEDDQDVSRRKLALYFDKIIKKAEKARKDA